MDVQFDVEKLYFALRSFRNGTALDTVGGAAKQGIINVGCGEAVERATGVGFGEKRFRSYGFSPVSNALKISSHCSREG